MRTDIENHSGGRTMQVVGAAAKLNPSEGSVEASAPPGFRRQEPLIDLSGYRPVKVCDLMRLGRTGDGGYVVSERSVCCADVLVSFGVGTDWSFEAAFLMTNPSAKLLAVDGTVNAGEFRNRAVTSFASALKHGLVGRGSVLQSQWRNAVRWRHLANEFRKFFRNESRRFICSMVQDEIQGGMCWNDARQLASTLFGLHSPTMFVKVDIEGSEYRVLPEILRDADRISGLVVEFHDCDLLAERLDDLLRAVCVDFQVIHVHANNCAALIPGSHLPRALEFTFMHRRLIRPTETTVADETDYPLAGLDFPNDSRFTDPPVFAKG